MYPHQTPNTNTNGFGPHHPSPAAEPSTPQAESTPSQYLPRQVFSSPTDNPYPASTLAAVEATRARFFARQSGTTQTATQSAPRPRPRSRSTLTGSTSLSESRKRTHKTQPLSSASSSAYRQSFFERCQRAMDHSRSIEREKKVYAFRRGKDGFTSGLFSDEMDVEEEEEFDSSPSSPPLFEGEEGAGEREEDNELTRRKIIAEYTRLKRIYELKGHLEIGWIDPDQLSWLENEAKQQHDEEHQHTGEEEVMDPYWGADDEQLEQLWIESMSQAQQIPLQGGDCDDGVGGDAGDGAMMMDEDVHDEWEEDAAFEEALARLPV
ncbi:uncharacterized protein UTRI_01001 [Ustilago trichophora]|uniref:Uncharacterized protein n=1 Tax=Ustilago trichophora TaxID=86804 RepID=A0A5C3DV74_9BASI|nr:uncharacterized protein UTRI_01001 [Ustilago trichophora]